MLELYHNNMSTCAQKARFALAEKGATWHSHHLDLRARDQQRPEYIKLISNAVVPTLVHDGVVIIESTVINARRSRRQGARAAVDKAARRWAAWPSPAKRERSRSTIFEGVKSPLFRESILRFDALLARMDKTLESYGRLAGDSFSLADFAYAPYLTRIGHLQLSSRWAHRSSLTAWYDRICKAAGYQEGLAKWFNPKYRTLMQEKGRQDWPFVEQILAEPAWVEGASFTLEMTKNQR